MEVLKDIPFELDADQVLSEAQSDPSMVDMDFLQEIMVKAREVAHPKAAFEVCYITGRRKTEVELGDVCLESPVLAYNLQDVERVFAYVATCGVEIDEAFSDVADILEKYWCEMVKTVLLRHANDFLVDHLQRIYRMEKIASMNPGSGDASIWPIDQQRELFRLLGDVEEELGVHLTDSCLMMPNKSISGVIFPTEANFKNCQVCHRENCPSRRAPFDQKLWEEVHQ